jgi:amino acid adenylation domain-containing protein
VLAPEFQRSIPARFFHPTGVFGEMPVADLERAIPELFAHRARVQPERTAVSVPGWSMTYAELDRASDRLAAAIIHRCGAAPEPVAVLLERGPGLIVATLGVLRAGKILVVLEPGHPAAHNAAVLEDARPALVLGDRRSAGAAAAAGLEAERLLATDALDDVAGEPRALAPAIAGDTLAAIVFTSGTTGRPKGVVHLHRSLLHNVRQLVNVLHLTPEDRVPLLQPMSAILGLRMPWVVLLSGGILLPFDATQAGPERLAAWLREERITYYQSAPTLFRHLVGALTPDDRFPHLRAVRVGGEPVTRSDFELYRRHFGDHAALLVTYNTAEGSTIAWFVADAGTHVDDDVMPVGYAREGTEILLWDDTGRPVADGEVGEIVVRSRYNAQGYWRRPELTAERFLSDPAGGDERLFRTGDLGRMLADGRLVHLGRNDQSVKVRGFRVEPSAVEAALMADPEIKEAVVVPRRDRGDERLVAYVVPRHPPGPSLEAIRAALAAHVPAHMVPASIVVLEAMPLTSTAKVARQALPAPGDGRPPLAEPFVAPRTAVELHLARIWEEVLSVAPVGVHDGFLDLGGASLEASRIAARVEADLGAGVPTSTLLGASTVADMALVVVEALARSAPGALADFEGGLDAPADLR